MSTRAGLVFLAGIVAIVCAAVAIAPSIADLVLLAALFGVFTAPGWPLARWVAGSSADRLTRTLLAGLLGYLAGAILYTALRAAHVTSPFLVLAGCILLAFGLQRAVPRQWPGLLRLQPLEAADRAGLGLLWLVVALIVGPVFARVGAPTAAGLAYRAYFIADLFAHMSVVGELVKGATPPINPFLPTESLPYYWTYFSFPAIYSALRPDVMLHAGILFADLLAAAIFVGIAYLVVRNLGASALATTASWLVMILAASFEGIYYLWRQWHYGRPLAELRITNIDAVTRWLFQLPGTDGLQRLMWWTPQHEMAITMGLLLLGATVLARDRRALGQGVLDGLLLGGAFAFSSFNGLLLVGWYAVAETLDLALDRGRGFTRWLIGRGLAALIVLTVVGLTVALGMIQRTPGAFIFGWNRYLLRAPWRFVILSFGPSLLGLLGTTMLIRRWPRLAVSMLAMLGITVPAFLYFDIRGHENTYVIFRTAQLWLLLLAVGLALAIDAWRRWPRMLAVAVSGVLIVGSLAGLPTVAIDWYNARDISNVQMNPGGFPWTVHIGPYDQVAIRWIQQHVPVDSTVQTDALARARGGWAFAAAFARRRMGTGLGLFEPNPTRFESNMNRIHTEIFQSADPSLAHLAAREIGVNYVYVGDLERRADANGVAKFSTAPDLFERVLVVGDVEIYRVK